MSSMWIKNNCKAKVAPNRQRVKRLEMVESEKIV